jgi:hypothetical protein
VLNRGEKEEEGINDNNVHTHAQKKMPIEGNKNSWSKKKTVTIAWRDSL